MGRINTAMWGKRIYISIAARGDMLAPTVFPIFFLLYRSLRALFHLLHFNIHLNLLTVLALYRLRGDILKSSFTLAARFFFATQLFDSHRNSLIFAVETSISPKYLEILSSIVA